MTVVTIVVVAVIVQTLLVWGLVKERGRLNSARAKSEAILRALPDMMFLISADGIYLDYHGSEDQLFVPPSRFVGKSVRDIMPADLATRFEQAFRQARESSKPQIVEYTLPIDGEDRNYEARIVACQNTNFLSIVRDTTAWRRTERSLEEQSVQLQASNAHARDLAGRLIASQELERARIARNLHDELGQKLAMLSLQVDGVVPGSRPTDPTRTKELKTRIEEISTDVHRLSYELHPAKLETLGLVAAIDSCCREVSERHQLSVSFRRENVPHDVDGEIAVCLYRVVQEALHNIVKHSGASAAEVWLTCDDGQVDLRIADRGRGFHTGGRSQGLGLVSMRERVQFFGGRFVVRSTPGNGTRIGVRIPLSPTDQDQGQSGLHIA